VRAQPGVEDAAPIQLVTDANPAICRAESDDPLATVDDQHRALAVLSNRSGNAAESDVLEAGEPAGPDHDQVSVAVLGDLDDLVPNRSPVNDHGFNLETRLAGQLVALFGDLLRASRALASSLSMVSDPTGTPAAPKKGIFPSSSKTVRRRARRRPS
jgi:hypothetical protein